MKPSFLAALATAASLLGAGAAGAQAYDTSGQAYGPPAQGYGQTYGQNYGQNYGPSNQGYGAPNQGYGPPAQNYGRPPRPKIACAADIHALCSTAQPGKPAMRCLKRHVSQASPDCQASVQAARAMRAQRRGQSGPGMQSEGPPPQ